MKSQRATTLYWFLVAGLMRSKKGFSKNWQWKPGYLQRGINRWLISILFMYQKQYPLPSFGCMNVAWKNTRLLLTLRGFGQAPWNIQLQRHVNSSHCWVSRSWLQFSLGALYPTSLKMIDCDIHTKLFLWKMSCANTDRPPLLSKPHSTAVHFYCSLLQDTNKLNGYNNRKFVVKILKAIVPDCKRLDHFLSWCHVVFDWNQEFWGILPPIWRETPHDETNRNSAAWQALRESRESTTLDRPLSPTTSTLASIGSAGLSGHYCYYLMF